MYTVTLGGERFQFGGLSELLGRAGELKAGDQSCGLAARSHVERAAAKLALADVRLSDFVENPLIDDAVTALLRSHHDPVAFAPVASMTVGELRELVLDQRFPPAWSSGLAGAITAEIAAAVAKIMSDKDLVVAAAQLHTVTQFRSTMGQPGVLGCRLQPNHPTDDVDGILVSVLDGLLMGCGDALIGVNPANDSPASVTRILHALHEVIEVTGAPTQNCVLAHITTQLRALGAGAPLDLAFQSLAGTEAALKSFGVTVGLLEEVEDTVKAAHRGRGDCPNDHRVTYFETGQGSSLSAGAHGGIDQLTLEARAQGLAKCFNPFLVNSVVGFIGPEYLANGSQIVRAGLEDHFTGKLQGIPMGCDVCFTNHVEADANSNDDLLLLLAAAGCTFVMGVPAGDDIMLGYQSTSYHDVHAVRRLFGRRPAPEFELWLTERGLWEDGRLLPTPPALVGSLMTKLTARSELGR